MNFKILAYCSKSIFPFLLLAVFHIKSQNKAIDSLKIALKNEKQDTARIKLIYLIGEVQPIMRIGFWDTLKLECEKLIETNSGMKVLFFKKYLAGSSNNIGVLLQERNEFSSSLTSLFYSLKLRKEINDNKGLAESYFNLALTFEHLGKINNAITYLDSAKIFLSKVDDIVGELNVNNRQSVVYLKVGNVSAAIKLFTNNLMLADKSRNMKFKARTYSNLAVIYTDINDSLSAIKYYNKAIEIYNKTNNTLGLISTYNAIGVLYANNRNYEASRKFLFKSYDIYKASILSGETQNELTICYESISELYLSLNKIDSALLYANYALKIKGISDRKNEYSRILAVLSKIYFQKGDHTKALYYSELSYQLAKELGSPNLIRKSSELLSKIYYEKKDFRNAYLFRIEFEKMVDSTKKTEVHNEGIKHKYQIQYYTDSISHAKETEIKDIEISKKDAEIRLKRNEQYSLAVGLILILGFAGFLFKKVKLTQKQKQIIIQQKHLVDEKHKEITDSINYAERIQRSFLATKYLLDENLKDYFVFFKPKDVVSGDFYWASKLSNGNFVLAIADSTGHGVPGAIMSILNISSLEKTIEQGLLEPADIFNHTRKTIIDRLKNDGSAEGGKDGMDCSLISFDFKNNSLTYAAANSSVWIVREKKIIELSPDKMPIGKHDNDNVSFTQHKLELIKGDVLYALTDGMPDQFGGPKGKKFMYKQLKDLLISLASESMDIQKQKLSAAFNNWKSDLEQVDDVTIIGVRV
jgi:serine phosphatase RsbU (regulator of sigma subunit)